MTSFRIQLVAMALALPILSSCTGSDECASVFSEAHAGEMPESVGEPQQDGVVAAKPPRKSVSGRPVASMGGGARVRFSEQLRLGPMRFNIIDVNDAAKVPDEEVVRYRAMVEQGLEEEADEFVNTIDRVLSDPEGWSSAGVRFLRVAQGEDITILLARPRSVDRLCNPFKTGGWLSCALMRRANLNYNRWKTGAKTWGDDVLGYRSYLINHEVGHLLGLKHFRCKSPGEPAPVMLPQTKFLQRCKPNGAPTEKEKAALGRALVRFKSKTLKRRARRAARR